jgi:hypothetical protein
MDARDGTITLSAAMRKQLQIIVVTVALAGLVSVSGAAARHELQNEERGVPIGTRLPDAARRHAGRAAH